MTEQPVVTTHIADGVLVAVIQVEGRATFIPQHAHVFAHTTLLMQGSMRVLCDGVDRGVFSAPQAVFIPAKAKHTFITVSDGVTFACVHNVGDKREVAVFEEHQFTGAP